MRDEKAWFRICEKNNDYYIELTFNPSGFEEHGHIELNKDEDIIDFYLNLNKIDSEIYYAEKFNLEKKLKMFKLFNKKANEDGLIAKYMITDGQADDIIKKNHEERTSGVIRGIKNALYNKDFVIMDNFPIKKLDNNSKRFKNHSGNLIIPIKKEFIQTSLDTYAKKVVKQKEITNYT